MAKRGRKPKLDNLDETQGGGGTEIPDPRVRRFLGKRAVQYSVTERIREKIDPDSIIDYWVMVLQGHVPLWVPDKKSPSGFKIIPDPSPLIGTSTPAQRDAAIRELNNRGWGMAVQSLQIDAHMRNTLEIGIPPELLEKNNYAALAKIRDALMLTDVTDAELIPEENVSAIANSVPTEPISEGTNENSAPEDDSSTLLELNKQT